MRKAFTVFFVVVVMFTAGSGQQSAQRGQPSLERQYTETVRPFTVKYCLSCHGEKSLAAQFDLRPYTTMAAVVKDHEHWAVVLTKLETGEMPPASAVAQPTPEERRAVIAWVDAMRKAEAKRNAGDPGLVLARRLSNAEYNNTIRDLTGQDAVSFCYPYGFTHTYNVDTLQVLGECGYSMAFNTVRREALIGVEPRYELPRFDTRDVAREREVTAGA